MGRKISSKTLALNISKIALDKKAQEIVIIDIAEKVDYADYLVICTGTSRRHVKTISNEMEGSLKRKRVVPLGIEGEVDGNWILMDYGSVVVHIFHSDTRHYYAIDGLWLDADRLAIDDNLKPSSKA